MEVSTAVQPTEANDKVLARRVAAGDHEAFRILFERHKTIIYRFCMLMIDDVNLAQDVYQDVFLGFYAACRKGTPMYNVRAYLLTSTRHSCLNIHRYRDRIELVDALPETRCEFDPTTIDLADHLRDALQQIPPEQREAFLLFEIEGLSYERIAQTLELSVGAVRNRIYRAKQELQKILGPVLRDE